MCRAGALCQDAVRPEREYVGASSSSAVIHNVSPNKMVVHVCYSTHWITEQQYRCSSRATITDRSFSNVTEVKNYAIHASALPERIKRIFNSN